MPSSALDRSRGVMRCDLCDSVRDGQGSMQATSREARISRVAFSLVSRNRYRYPLLSHLSILGMGKSCQAFGEGLKVPAKVMVRSRGTNSQLKRKSEPGRIPGTKLVLHVRLLVGTLRHNAWSVRRFRSPTSSPVLLACQNKRPRVTPGVCRVPMTGVMTTTG
jgi:hypothetical protein